ncbi:MAG: acetylglutamate kinase [Candidatus Hydrogenedentes bacterium]|jgi:acetylglutamate kinase|nr:acetylglutamate kinase [Candidatus Hydrogenedentota bacterium]
MEQSIQKASVLIEALPYIRAFEGKTVVIKYGGSAMNDPVIRRNTAEDVVLMKYVGMNPVVVHGGGPAINRTLKQLGLESKFHEGLRVTTDEVIAVVEMVLAGSVNKDLVNLLNSAGGNAVGLTGKDANLLHAKKVETSDGADIGHVGQVIQVNCQIIQVLSSAGMIPVIAPIATDSRAGTWNVNADTAAGEIAAALKAEKLVFLTDTPGLLANKDDPATLIHQIQSSEVAGLTERGVISGGMIPKINACMKALDSGVNRTHIIDGRVPHALLLEIFTDKGLGTLVSR